MMNEKQERVMDEPAIRIELARAGPIAGRWKIYISGEYRGSAKTNAEAIRSAKEMLRQMHENGRKSVFLSDA